jgi:hypothetical protein
MTSPKGHGASAAAIASRALPRRPQLGRLIANVLSVYSPACLSAPTDTVSASVAAQADAGRLTIYAGAGLSWAAPTGLPGSGTLAKRIAAHLASVVDFGEIKRDDLLAVADEVAKQPLGRMLLERTLLKAADFEHARANYGHEVVAMLLCEGVSTVFETNYDLCIEFAAQPERPRVVVTDEDLRHGATTALLKAHGCASMPSTMLITSDDLKDTPLWAKASVAARLSQDQVLFVGIGSVADYVQESIKDVLKAVGVSHLLVVDPALAAWDEDPELAWRKLLGELPEEQRETRGASEFLDAVLRAYAQEGLSRVRALVAGFNPEHRQRVGTEVVLSALEGKDAVQAVRWLRRATWKLEAGHRVVGDATTTHGLLALGSLTGSDFELTFGDGGWARATRAADPAAGTPMLSQAVLLMMVNGAHDGAAAAREAGVRVAEAKRGGQVGLAEDVVVVVIRCIGSLGLEEITVAAGDTLSAVLARAASQLQGMPTDLVGGQPEDHLIDAGSVGGIFFVRGEQAVVTCSL